MGLASGANRLVIQSLGHVSRHAPIGCLGCDAVLRRVQLQGCGLARPIWVKRGNVPGHYSQVRHLSFGWQDLPTSRQRRFRP